MAHTQKEWRAKTTAFGFCILGGRASKAMAERYFARKPSRADLIELHANAHLIAAAPDLLRLAERYVDVLEGVYAEMGKKVPTNTQYRLSKEVIAKATEKGT